VGGLVGLAFDLEVVRWGAMNVPASPWQTVPLLFLDPADSEFCAFLQEAHTVVERNPALLAAIEADLDRHSLEKKSLRVADARWWAARGQPLPMEGLAPAGETPEPLRLGVGRPRTPAYVVYMFLVGRGYFGGFKTSEATTLMLESVTLRVFLANQHTTLPGRSTLTDLVNAVSVDTREKILDAQIRAVLQEQWDDFTLFLQDSTAVEANALWPTDSRLMLDLAQRLWRRIQQSLRVGLPRTDCLRLPALLLQMARLDRQINLETPRGKRKRARSKLYRKLLLKAGAASVALASMVEWIAERLPKLVAAPSVRAQAARYVAWMQTDVSNLRRVIANCHARIVLKETVAPQDKVYSVSDADAAMIVKSERDPVVGYKPQLARSRQGFVTGLLVPQGNASDARQLVPMFEAVVRRTGVVPKIASVDDGYASVANYTALKGRAVGVVSISGSKGSKITPPEAWASEDYETARDDRSAVESLMFTIKDGFDFGRVARRGLRRVHEELLEKVLAYNFCRMAALRRQKQTEQRAAA
jgi:Transposase DDE domain